MSRKWFYNNNERIVFSHVCKQYSLCAINLCASNVWKWMFLKRILLKMIKILGVQCGPVLLTFNIYNKFDDVKKFQDKNIVHNSLWLIRHLYKNNHRFTIFSSDEINLYFEYYIWDFHQALIDNNLTEIEFIFVKKTVKITSMLKQIEQPYEETSQSGGNFDFTVL